MTTAEQLAAAKKAAKKAGVDAAMTLAEDIATGRLDPAALDAAAAAEARALFGRVEGPGDPLWELHVDVARQVLAVGGGIPANELAEWAAVYRLAEGVETEREPSWIERALAEGDDEPEV
ncbi:flagellar hook-length control protein [Mycobacterium sp. LTG2003]